MIVSDGYCSRRCVPKDNRCENHRQESGPRYLPDLCLREDKIAL